MDHNTSSFSAPFSLTSATPTPTGASCTGDCNGDHVVSIDELITGVNIALGTQSAGACPALQNADGEVDIARLISSVGKALNGCESA
jgi:hypothetical protein